MRSAPSGEDAAAVAAPRSLGWGWGAGSRSTDRLVQPLTRPAGASHSAAREPRQQQASLVQFLARRHRSSHRHIQAQVLGVLGRRGPFEGAWRRPLLGWVLVPVIEVVKGRTEGMWRVRLCASPGCQVLRVLHSTHKGKNILDDPILPRGQSLRPFQSGTSRPDGGQGNL